MNKRDFLKAGFISTAGLASIPAFGRRGNFIGGGKEFKVPDLPYAYDALEPYIDKETMEIHHLKHHAGYAAKLNTALSEGGVKIDKAWSLLEEASKYPASITNNAGGYINHKIFWKCLSPKGGGVPTGAIASEINKEFGSFEVFKDKFSTAAKTQFGSGWAWLVVNKGKLKIVKTANQDNPIMDILPPEIKGRPLLCIDVWEHAYYLKYQNRRADYIDAFWNIVNWDFVNTKFEKISKA